MLSLRRAPNLGTSWCPHRVCAQPDSGTIDIFFLASSPHFSHPHGICRYISTTVGAHHGADRGVDWSSDPDGIFLCVRREPRLRPDYQTWGNRLRGRLFGTVWGRRTPAARCVAASRQSSPLHRQLPRGIPSGCARLLQHHGSAPDQGLHCSTRRREWPSARNHHDGRNDCFELSRRGECCKEGQGSGQRR